MLIRELTSADRAAAQFTFRRLGERSRLQRYLFPKRLLREQDLDYLTRLDHWHDEALIAFSPLPRAPVGIARYARQADFDTAEIAIEVVDHWQRQGVGGTLALALRECAMRAGVRCFIATISPENVGAMTLASRLGRVSAGVAVSGSQNVIVELSLTPSPLPRPGRLARL